MPDLVEQVLERSGYLDSLEAERTVEAQGRDREPPGARRRRPRVPAFRRGSEPVTLPPGDLALLRPGCAARGAEPCHAHDPAQREGARVQRRLHDRDGGADLPALEVDRGTGDRGGAEARLCRDDAGEGDAHAAARVCSLALRDAQLQPSVTVPGRAARAARRARSAATRFMGRLRSAGRGDAALGRSVPADRRFGAAWKAGRGRRDAHRARRASSRCASPTTGRSGG